MRVTENTNFDTIRDTVRRSKERMEGLQLQAATLKKVNTPSDDPIGSAKLLELRTEKTISDQFQANGRLAEAFLTNSENAIAELGDIVVRAKEIALGQSSGASSNEETRLGVAEEISQLFQQAVATANRRIGDRYLFGGYQTQRSPVGVDGRYSGDNGQMMVEIGRDVFIAMNVPGQEVFNTNPKAAPGGQGGYAPQSRIPASEDGGAGAENVNLFDELQNLRIGLLSGDLEGVRNTLDRFDRLHGRLVALRGKLGSRMQGMEVASQSQERQNITNAHLSSAIEDADMAKVMSDLAKEETVYKTVLAGSKRLIQPTLMDFLK